jgi:pilus assembly protein CpaE
VDLCGRDHGAALSADNNNIPVSDSSSEMGYEYMGVLKAETVEPAPITAIAVGRDIQGFDLLIEDIETELADGWGGLDLDDAIEFMDHIKEGQLEFVAVAIDKDDENNLKPIALVIQKAKALNISVILVAEDLSPMALHQLMRLGADEFAPYPLPEGAFSEAVANIRKAPESQIIYATPQAAAPSRNGTVLPVYGVAGGVGSSTLAVNLACELAQLGQSQDLKVLLMDLDIQFGSIATYLDLPRKEANFEILADIATMDDEAFRQTTQKFNDNLDVFAAPPEAIPLDFIGQEDVDKLITTAMRSYDFIVIDMPTALVSWTETTLNHASVFFAVLESDMRSAQNAQRFIRALKAEDLPIERVRFALSRSPSFSDMAGKSRAKRMAEGLDISLEMQLPDGGKQVPHACDHGLPLHEHAKKNPLRKEIHKTAVSLFEIALAEQTAD